MLQRFLCADFFDQLFDLLSFVFVADQSGVVSLHDDEVLHAE